ncbi:1-aminocyclopropane-1-carboxylate deaminase/D-cysteine desulfhydrase [Rasiella sp. SM2506]|uniref:1-aminocyclopropane-1-carboxylate deaminase/D-cysteine desulfhydrase n=1 Tax=Rasiella sp. SM2506 TaxID=3423914 RepID=UPI003D7B8498
MLRLENLIGTQYTVALKREDMLHPFVSGNKFRKLKYNIAEALDRKNEILITFGGAYSNHISATAVAGKLAGLKTVGVIRGEELAANYKGNATLEFAKSNGMTFEFVSREDYKMKEDKAYLASLSEKYPNAYLLPEGGTNTLAIQGCAEILTEDDADFDYVCTAVGTGGTLAGLVAASKAHQTVVGYSALKGTFQATEVEKYTQKTNYVIKDDYCFGGYAKIDSQLVRFMNEFKQETGVLLDPVYTAKMLFGIIEDIKLGHFPENSRILAIHTGGLQGISGMNKKLKKKNLPQIHT